MNKCTTAADNYLQFENDINDLGLHYLFDYFYASGLLLNKVSRITKTTLQDKLHINKKYVKFLEFILVILSKKQWIKFNESNIEILVDYKSLTPSEKLYATINVKYPQFQQVIFIFKQIVSQYPKILSEKTPAIAVLYPDANLNYLDPVTNILLGLSSFDRYKKILKKLFYLKSKKASISILEVGGGSGKLTWQITPILKNKNSTYLFTDISRFFLLKAREIAKENNINIINFAQFDITLPATDDNIIKNKFDYIIAFNVIHATSNLEITINNLTSLLSQGGQLIIIEHTNLPVWAQMIWGVAEGWWYFDDEYRVNTPLIEFDSWRKILLKCGYKTVRLLSEQNADIPLAGIIACKE